MIYNINTRNKKLYPTIVDFCSTHFDYDFYCTLDNSRLFVTDEKNLKLFFKDAIEVLTLEECGDYQGFLVIWKSKHFDKVRYYIKLTAVDKEVARKLLTILLWNYKGKEIFAKIRKDNKFLSLLKDRGFRFLGGRGFQILLKLKLFHKPSRENKYVRDFNHSRNTDSIHS